MCARWTFFVGGVKRLPVVGSIRRSKLCDDDDDDDDAKVMEEESITSAKTVCHSCGSEFIFSFVVARSF